VSIDAEKAPFFVNKIKLVFLPSILCFRKGFIVDRLTGFSELGDRDDFDSILLVRRLIASGCM